jgi:hypothetical protein
MGSLSFQAAPDGYFLEGVNTWKGNMIMASIKLKIPETAMPSNLNGSARIQIIG